MKTHVDKRPPPLVLITGIAVILFSAAGSAAIANWSPAATGGSSAFLLSENLPATPAPPVSANTRTKTKCAECGVILSVREIEARTGGALSSATDSAPGDPDELRAQSDRQYEFTILMADRSLRWINDDNPAFWRLGERVVFIDSSGL